MTQRAASIAFRLSVAVMFALTFGVYSLWLAYSPIHLHEAEVLFALHARSIAVTFHDSTGRFLPLYFHMPVIGPNVWFHPMLVYFSAIFLKVLPFTESSRSSSSCRGAFGIRRCSEARPIATWSRRAA